MSPLLSRLKSHRGRRRELPIPPLEMRQLVGPTDPAAFDNPDGRAIFDGINADASLEVFDFGCGCGRTARQLLQQQPRPRRYVGVDLHRGMIEWCRENLQPHDPTFEFLHHDVRNLGLNPGADKPDVLPLPVEDSSFALVNAFSVFTHLTERQTEHYLREVARILSPSGILYSTWFLFDKTDFPMMQEFQNALFINDVDPSNAVIYDRTWLQRTARAAGLTIYRIVPPEMRGYHWLMLMTPRRDGVEDAAFPADEAPAGALPPPLMPADAQTIGL